MTERLETFSGGNEAIEFGPKNTHPVFLSCINEIEQIRKTYPADKIEDLANAIEQVDPSTKEVDFDLYNPLLAALLTPVQAKKYLQEHKKFYGESSSTNLSDLTTLENDMTIILVAGHRRKRAIEFLSDKYELGDPMVKVNLRQGITFEEGLIAQIRENTYEKVSPEETAKNIEQYYQYLLEIDPSKKPKVSTLSAKTGLSEFTIRSGLKYMSIPERIRDISKEYPKVISYTVLVQMEPLMRAHEDYYDFKGLSEDKNEYVVNSLLSTVHTILNAKLTTQEHYAKLINGKIDSLNNSISFDQDAFFELERETSEEIVRKTGSQLLKTSVSTLRVALATRGGGDLSSDDERLLTDLVQYIEEKELRPEEPQSQELF